MESNFKLPIEYNSFKTLDDVVRKDLEIFTSDDETQPANLYKKLIGDSLLINKWSSMYTAERKFIKDTQKCIKKYRIENVNTSDISKDYVSFISETNFDDKYQYIGIPQLKPLNNSTTFLHCLGLYNLGAPVFSLVTPLMILIIPYLIIKDKGCQLTIHAYIESLKEIMKSTSLYTLFMGNMDTQKKMSAIVSIFIYFLQVYNNIVSCISFYKNINVVYTFLIKYREYLVKTNDMMTRMNQLLNPFKTYDGFIQNMHKEQSHVQSWIHKLNQIYPTEYTTVKVGQLGLLMQMHYELFNNDLCRLSFDYTIHLHQFNCDMNSFKTLVKSKKLGKCKFGDHTKFNGLYYLSQIDQDYISNDVSLKENIILSAPNGSGKTTIIKSFILNTFMSQHLGYSCYKKATINCYDYFHSYLNIVDTSGRDSLFQAEVRRCQNIIDQITQDASARHLCIFDEILSGTNPTDAVVCSEYYLNQINSHKEHVDCIISTHFIKLCETFDKHSCVKNKKMDVTLNDDDIKYLYKMVDGISYINGGKFVIKQIKEGTI